MLQNIINVIRINLLLAELLNNDDMLFSNDARNDLQISLINRENNI